MTIEELWQKYRSEAIKEEVDEVDLDGMKRLFFAGALSLMQEFAREETALFSSFSEDFQKFDQEMQEKYGRTMDKSQIGD